MPQLSRILSAACVTCTLLLQACAATSPACPNVSTQLPGPPLPGTPAPAQPYSKTWQSEVDSWRSAVQISRERLMATPLMPD
jgi:hypothetical protein